jgi:ribonuclease VapC
MIIDTSAIIAILRDESEAAFCARAIADASNRRVSTVNYVEAAVVIDASGDPIANRQSPVGASTSFFKYTPFTSQPENPLD